MTYADARLMSKGICVHDTGSFNSGIVIIYMLYYALYCAG